MAILLVYKENPQDPCLQAMKRWIRKLAKKSIYFRFRHVERGRFETKEINERLENIIKSGKVTCIMDWNGLCNTQEIILIKIKGIIYFRYINGFTSLHCGHTADQREFFDQLKLADFFMVPEKNHVHILRKENINAIHCNFFADPMIYKPLRSPFRSDWYDFFFVGAVNDHWAKNRRSFLSLLAEKNKTMIVAGPDAKIIKATCLPQVTYEPLVNLLQNQSRIVCGSDFLPSVKPYNERIKNAFINYDLSHTIRARTFTVLASARPYLVESHKDIENLFEKGREILTWENHDEMMEIADRCLVDKKYLKSVGDAGYNSFLSQHTVFHRLQEFEKLSGFSLFPELQKYISWTNSNHR